MVVLQKMQNSIFSTLSLVRHFSGKRSLCAECRLYFFVPFTERHCPQTEVSGERTNMFLTSKWLCLTAKYP